MLKLVSMQKLVRVGFKLSMEARQELELKYLEVLAMIRITLVQEFPWAKLELEERANSSLHMIKQLLEDV